MTDVPGVLRDKNDIGTKIHELNIRQCRTLIQEGIIAGGMIPKVSAQAARGERKSTQAQQPRSTQEHTTGTQPVLLRWRRG